MRIPRFDKRVKLVNGANGWAATASCTVTATIIDWHSPGCPARVGLTTSHPDAGRKRGARVADVNEDAAVTKIALRLNSTEKSTGRREGRVKRRCSRRRRV